jgi:hypothetical protein
MGGEADAWAAGFGIGDWRRSRFEEALEVGLFLFLEFRR